MSEISIYQTLFGSMFHLSRDECIGQSLKLYGQWAIDEIAILFKVSTLAGSGDFIDLGANVGTHTVSIGKLLPNRHVHSIEAQEVVFRLLSANTLVNGLMNVHLHHCLVGAETKLVRAASSADVNSNNFGAVQFRVLEEEDRKTGADLLIQAAVDDIFPTDSVVACIKADLEGAELEGLIGARKTIERCFPAIYFEQNADGARDFIFNFLTARSYNLFWHVNFPFDTDNYKGEMSNIFGPTVERNVLCLHKSSPLLQWFAERLIPVSEAFSDGVLASCALLNNQLRSELRSAVEHHMTTDLLLAAQRQLAIDFHVLREDRILAQRVIELQLAEINKLKNSYRVE